MDKDVKAFVKDLLVIILFLIIFIIFSIIGMNQQKNTIENLETKLNTYEQSYINYAVEDSIRQVK